MYTQCQCMSVVPAGERADQHAGAGEGRESRSPDPGRLSQQRGRPPSGSRHLRNQIKTQSRKYSKPKVVSTQNPKS